MNTVSASFIVIGAFAAAMANAVDGSKLQVRNSDLQNRETKMRANHQTLPRSGETLVPSGNQKRSREREGGRKGLREEVTLDREKLN